ncbi:hypothetical protein HDU93_007230 [Gonapodya sp. JEL0774]|nr:hypothetical protein HDU93_007230 [Gonapodya sp. JEL0774]
MVFGVKKKGRKRSGQEEQEEQGKREDNGDDGDEDREKDTGDRERDRDSDPAGGVGGVGSSGRHSRHSRQTSTPPHSQTQTHTHTLRAHSAHIRSRSEGDRLPRSPSTPVAGTPTTPTPLASSRHSLSHSLRALLPSSLSLSRFRSRSTSRDISPPPPSPSSPVSPSQTKSKKKAIWSRMLSRSSSSSRSSVVTPVPSPTHPSHPHSRHSSSPARSPSPSDTPSFADPLSESDLDLDLDHEHVSFSSPPPSLPSSFTLDPLDFKPGLTPTPSSPLVTYTTHFSSGGSEDGVHFDDVCATAGASGDTAISHPSAEPNSNTDTHSALEPVETDTDDDLIYSQVVEEDEDEDGDEDYEHERGDKSGEHPLNHKFESENESESAAANASKTNHEMDLARNIHDGPESETMAQSGVVSDDPMDLQPHRIVGLAMGEPRTSTDASKTVTLESQVTVRVEVLPYHEPIPTSNPHLGREPPKAPASTPPSECSFNDLPLPSPSPSPLVPSHNQPTSTPRSIEASTSYRNLLGPETRHDTTPADIWTYPPTVHTHIVMEYLPNLDPDSNLIPMGRLGDCIGVVNEQATEPVLPPLFVPPHVSSSGGGESVVKDCTSGAGAHEMSIDPPLEIDPSYDDQDERSDRSGDRRTRGVDDNLDDFTGLLVGEGVDSVGLPQLKQDAGGVVTDGRHALGVELRGSSSTLQSTHNPTYASMQPGLSVQDTNLHSATTPRVEIEPRTETGTMCVIEGTMETLEAWSGVMEVPATCLSTLPSSSESRSPTPPQLTSQASSVISTLNQAHVSLASTPGPPPTAFPPFVNEPANSYSYADPAQDRFWSMHIPPDPHWEAERVKAYSSYNITRNGWKEAHDSREGSMECPISGGEGVVTTPPSQPPSACSSAAIHDDLMPLPAKYPSVSSSYFPPLDTGTALRITTSLPRLPDSEHVLYVGDVVESDERYPGRRVGAVTGTDVGDAKVVDDTEPESLSNEPTPVPPGTILVTCFSFSATKADELTIHTGETLVATECPEGGWWKAIQGTGKAQTVGWFPAVCTKCFREEENRNQEGGADPQEADDGSSGAATPDSGDSSAVARSPKVSWFRKLSERRKSGGSGGGSLPGGNGSNGSGSSGSSAVSGCGNTEKDKDPLSDGNNSVVKGTWGRRKRAVSAPSAREEEDSLESGNSSSSDGGTSPTPSGKALKMMPTVVENPKSGGNSRVLLGSEGSVYKTSDAGTAVPLESSTFSGEDIVSMSSASPGTARRQGFGTTFSRVSRSASAPSRPVVVGFGTSRVDVDVISFISIQAAQELNFWPTTGKWLDGLSMEVVAGLNVTEQKRQAAIWELFITERDYLKDLWILYEIYRKPLRDKKIIGTKGIDSLFGNLEEILNASRTMLRLFAEKRKANPVVISVGDSFLRMEILKYTNDLNADFKYLTQAVEQVEITLNEVNEATRRADSERRVEQLQSDFADKLPPSPLSYLIREDEVTQIKSIQNDERKQRLLLLFNNCVLLAKKDWRDKYQTIFRVPLDVLTIVDVADEGDYANMVEVTFPPPANRKSSEVVLLVLSSKGVKTAWVDKYTSPSNTNITRKPFLEARKLLEMDLQNRTESPFRHRLSLATGSSSVMIPASESEEDELDSRTRGSRSPSISPQVSEDSPPVVSTRPLSALLPSSWGGKKSALAIEEAKKKVTDLTSHLQESEESVQNLQRTIAELESRNKSLHAEKLSLYDEKMKLVGESEQARRALEETKTRLREAEDALNRNEQETRSQLSTALVVKDKALTDAQFQLRMAEARHDSEKLELRHSFEKELYESRSTMETAVVELKSTIDRMKQESNLKDHRIAQLESEKSSESTFLSREISVVKLSTQQALDGLKVALSETQTALKARDGTVAKQMEELGRLRGELASAKTFSETTRNDFHRMLSELEAKLEERNRLIASNEVDIREHAKANSQYKSQLQLQAAQIESSLRENEWLKQTVLDKERTLEDMSKCVADQKIAEAARRELEFHISSVGTTLETTQLQLSALQREYEGCKDREGSLKEQIANLSGQLAATESLSAQIQTKLEQEIEILRQSTGHGDAQSREKDRIITDLRSEVDVLTRNLSEAAARSNEAISEFKLEKEALTLDIERLRQQIEEMDHARSSQISGLNTLRSLETQYALLQEENRKTVQAFEKMRNRDTRNEVLIEKKGRQVASLLLVVSEVCRLFGVEVVNDSDTEVCEVQLVEMVSKCHQMQLENDRLVGDLDMQIARVRELESMNQLGEKQILNASDWVQRMEAKMKKRYNEILAEKKAIEAKLDELSSAFDNLYEGNVRLEKKVNCLSEQLETVTAHKVVLTSQVAELSERCAKAEHELEVNVAVTKEENLELRARLREMEGQLTLLTDCERSSVGELSSKVENLSIELEHWRGTASELEASQKKLQSNLEETSILAHDLALELDKARDSLAACEAEREETRGEHERYLHELERVRSELEMTQEELNELSTQVHQRDALIVTLADDLRAKEGRIGELNSAVLNAKAESHHFGSQLKDLELQVSMARKQKDIMEVDLLHLRGTMEVLQKQVRDTESMLSDETERRALIEKQMRFLMDQEGWKIDLSQELMCKQGVHQLDSVENVLIDRLSEFEHEVVRLLADAKKMSPGLQQLSLSPNFSCTSVTDSSSLQNLADRIHSEGNRIGQVPEMSRELPKIISFLSEESPTTAVNAQPVHVLPFSSLPTHVDLDVNAQQRWTTGNRGKYISQTKDNSRKVATMRAWVDSVVGE